jgi:hypothetical protein
MKINLLERYEALKNDRQLEKDIIGAFIDVGFDEIELWNYVLYVCIIESFKLYCTKVELSEEEKAKVIVKIVDIVEIIEDLTDN